MPIFSGKKIGKKLSKRKLSGSKLSGSKNDNRIKLKNLKVFIVKSFRFLVVGLLGFEPRMTESKSEVLPLHHNPIVCSKLNIWNAKVGDTIKNAKQF